LTDTYEAGYPAPPYHHGFEAYAAGKKRALLAAKDFDKEKKPLFDIIQTLPAFVPKPRRVKVSRTLQCTLQIHLCILQRILNNTKSRNNYLKIKALKI